MGKAGKLIGDYFGLIQVCGIYVASKWIIFVLFNLFAILNSRNLQSADRAMGSGPFEVTLKRYCRRFKVAGEGAFSGIREMYVRNVYLKNDWLTIKPYDTVVDLGANMGNIY